MAQQLRTPTVLPGALGSIPSTHEPAHTHHHLQSQGSDALSWHQACTWSHAIRTPIRKPMKKLKQV